MEVFGIGPLEIALIVLIAFIVLGPERIPGAMRQLGKWVRQMRETVTNITRDYDSDIRQITGEITALQDEIRSIQRDLGQMAAGVVAPPRPPDPDRSIRSTAPDPQNTIAPPLTTASSTSQPVAPSAPADNDDSHNP